VVLKQRKTVEEGRLKELQGENDALATIIKNKQSATKKID